MCTIDFVHIVFVRKPQGKLLEVPASLTVGCKIPMIGAQVLLVCLSILSIPVILQSLIMLWLCDAKLISDILEVLLT